MDSIKKICQVCGSAAKFDEVFCSHYGAVCCLSCKAFFRRIFREGSRNPDLLTCSALSGSPSKPGKRRKTCRKCRYDQCIRVGMSPQLVPDDDECKKYTYCKKSKKSELITDAIQSLSISYSECVFDLHMRSNMRLVFTIIHGHLATGHWTQDCATAVLSWIRHLQDFFIGFAKKSQYFASLNLEDQYLLLKRNACLFRNYILGRYC